MLFNPLVFGTPAFNTKACPIIWPVSAARALDRSAAVPLVTMTLMDNTVLRLSDRVITVDGVDYEPLIAEHDLVEENVSRRDSMALSADFSLKLLNSGARIDPEGGVIVEIFEAKNPYASSGSYLDELSLWSLVPVDGRGQVFSVIDGRTFHMEIYNATVTANELVGEHFEIYDDYFLIESNTASEVGTGHFDLTIAAGEYYTGAGTAECSVGTRRVWTANCLVGKTMEVTQAFSYPTQTVTITGNTPGGKIYFTPAVPRDFLVVPILKIYYPSSAHHTALVEINDAHPIVGAKVEVAYVFRDGTKTTPQVPLFVGIAEEPQNITRASLTLRCTGVPEYKAKAFSLSKMFSADFPLCLPSESGKAFPYLLGQFKTVECRRIRWPVFETDNWCHLNDNISADSTTINCVTTPTEGAGGFGEYGDEEKVIWIDGERIVWATKNTTAGTNYFSGCTRGTPGGTVAAAHTAGAIIAEYPTDYSAKTCRLTSAINSSQTTITVKTAAGFGLSSSLVIWIGSERITYTAVSKTQFTGCTRGTGGTAAAAHGVNALVTEFTADSANSAVAISENDLASVDAVYGEFGDLLAPISVYSTYFVDGRYEIEIPKSSLVVPNTILDEIDISGGDAVPSDDSRVALNDGFTTNGASSSKTFNWIANPYLDGGGIPQYTHTRLRLQLGITERSFTQYPTGQAGTVDRGGTLKYKIGSNPWAVMWSGSTHYRWWNGAWVEWWQVVGPGAFPLYITVPALNWGLDVGISWTVQPFCLFDVSVDASYLCILNGTALVKTGTVKDEKYFRRIYASGYGLPADSTFYGTAAAAITRPDHVMKKWIVGKLGFTEADIDTTSFDEAGTFYAAQSPEYALSVRVTEDVDPLDELYRMAFESRSIVYFALGKWYLKVIPSAAPASVRTISIADLAGAGAEFTCGYTRRDDVQNSLTLRWDKNDGPAGDKDRYRKSVLVENIVGNYPVLSGDPLELRMVYDANQAADVGDIYLLQRNRVMRTLSFPVFWDNTDLQIGDTITPTGMGFWEGVKFWIESVSRDGVNKATFNAVEWWE